MLAVIKLEYIAENYHAYKRNPHLPHARTERYSAFLGHNQSRPWVARIDGLDEKFGLARTFMRGRIDYSLANSVGSRGVYLYFHLKDGIYEVNERTSWTKVRRYFISIVDAQISEISREDVEQWLSVA